jgi:DNA-binding NarL/FixJ family response regulator
MNIQSPHLNTYPSENLSSHAHLDALSLYSAYPSEEAKNIPATTSALGEPMQLAVIDDRILLRECFVRSLQISQRDLSIATFSSSEDFEHAAADAESRIGVALLCMEWRKGRAAEYLAKIGQLVAALPDVKLIVVSEIEELHEVIAVIEGGARGYIPMSMGLEVALKAIHLVKAGGVFIPASVLSWSGRIISQMSETKSPRRETIFTPRQLAVAEALRRGKANKIIAYELNMCESTVKVHIRSIMKKLKARNRTEASFLMSKLVNGDPGLHRD